jgi:hypothetical protein
LRRVVDGIWKVAESSRMKEEDGEVWVQESRMKEHESTREIISPLPTQLILGKVSCTVSGAVSPFTIFIAHDK